MPISDDEAMRILHQVKEGVERPKPSITFEIGEQVRVADGPFASFSGHVEEVDEERSRLKVAVSIFGRPTPVELEFAQVERWRAEQVGENRRSFREHLRCVPGRSAGKREEPRSCRPEWGGRRQFSTGKIGSPRHSRGVRERGQDRLNFDGNEFGRLFGASAPKT